MTPINLRWKRVDDNVFLTHWREYILRLRHSPSGWIVSHEIEGGAWKPIVGAPTRLEAERKAAEWCAK